jgi:hypothetical protein
MMRLQATQQHQQQQEGATPRMQIYLKENAQTQIKNTNTQKSKS